MFQALLRYLNPMAHLGEKKYPLTLPLITTLIAYILLEVIGYLIVKRPEQMGDAIIFTTFALVLYFSFRSAIKGGLIVTGLSMLYYIYFIYTRHAPIAVKESALLIASLLTITNIIITLIIGWHRQTVDRLLDREIQAKQAAEYEQRRLKTLLEQLPVGVIISKAPTGEIISTNRQAQKLLGYSSKRVTALEEYKKVLIDGKKINGREVTITAHKRKKLILFINAAPIMDKKGEIIAAVATFYDITKQKEFEQQKEDFIAMASHELRTPLTSTKMYAQLLLKEFIKYPKATILVKKMDNQIDKLTNLVLTMLDTSQIQQGKLLFEEEPFFLKDIAFETITELQKVTKHKLIVDWQTRESVIGDKEKMAQVFTNLITNAIKYSPEKSEIFIRSYKKDGSIIVSIQDVGTGISKNEQKHIFDRFYQSNQHKTYSGLGLGLYISAEIIKQHGGKIWVNSGKEKGSTFYFSLPISKEVGV